MKLLGKATYKYHHIDDRVEEIQRQYIPENVTLAATYALPYVMLIMDRKVFFRWTFP